MKRNVEATLAVGFVILMALLSINGIISSNHLNRVIANRSWVTHTYQVIIKIEQLLSTLKDAETSQRGHLLTGQESYLAPYHAAADALPKQLQDLRSLTKDNADQQRRIDEIDRVVTARMQILQQKIELQRTQGEAAARKAVGSGQGQQWMQAARALGSQMEAEENRLLALRDARTEESERELGLTSKTAALLSLAFLCLLYYLLHRLVRERRQTAEAVQKREEWLATTLRSIGDAVLATDENGCILFMNPVAEALTRWKQEEARGRAAKEVFVIVNEATRAAVESPIEKVIAQGITVGLANHTILIAKDGSEIFIDDSGAPIRDADGSLIGVVLVFRDISARRAQEAEILTLNARLRRAMTETHHRVKNNLQLISALIDMQRAIYEETLPVAELDRLSQNVRALAVLHDVLTQETKTDGEAGILSVKQVLERLLPMIRQTVGDRRIDYTLDEGRLPGRKATAVALIANEIVSNAIKHGRGDVQFRFVVQDGTGTVEVLDYGPGFPAGFDPMTAANTGLDLIENLALYDLEGTIRYENRSEGGARVLLTFPIPSS